MLTVKYIGLDAAILGGAYIYSGETRADVTPGQLRAAQEFHPDGFTIVAGELPAAEPDPPITQPPTPDDEPPTTDQPELAIDAPIIDEPETAEEAPEAELRSLDEPAAQPQRRRQGR